MQQDRSRREQRIKRKAGIAFKIRGTADRPRLAVFRSNRFLSVQLIDDVKAETILSASIAGKTIEQAKTLGKEIAKLAANKKIQTVVFDRAGFRYHGAIEALATAAREGGLQF